ncbi:hypothetical protein ACFLYH_01665 [Candidatus Dependentiae bacterium]
MKKIALSLMAFGLFLGSINSKTHSDKTFLMPRDQISNLAMEYTTWHRNLHKKPDTLYNGTIQFVPFYQKSDNKTDIGKYLGFDRGSGIGIVNEISVDNPVAAGQSSGLDNMKNPAYMFHNRGTGAYLLNSKYSFHPYQEIYGIHLNYQQDLDGILDGLFLKIKTPIVNVKNSMDIKKVEETIPANGNGLIDYLSGNYENLVAGNLQEPLKYAKIDGGSHSSSGVADIDLQLGYTFWYKKNSRAALNMAMIIPTGKSVKGDYIFEPVHGNGHHWGIGLGLDTSATMWQNKNFSIEVMLVANYRYLFEGIEKRTLNFLRPHSPENTLAKAGYYELAGEANTDGNTPLKPLANLLTRDIRVTPGSQFDGIANLSLSWRRFIFDIGYNLYAKEEERTQLRYLWENDKYAVAGVTFDTAAAFNILTAADNATSFAYDGAPANTNAAINADNIDYESIQTPTQVTHKIYGGLGYQCDRYQYPIMLGLGGSYEFVADNTALENWAIWGKLGISW